MENFLTKIQFLKREEIEARKIKCPLSELKARIVDLPPSRDFRAALSGEKLSLVAEVKRASPSAGIISSDFDPAAIARFYAEGGASAISVLTEKNYFGGHLDHLRAVKEAVELPVLRKDFIFDDYQLYESRAAGADAVLLISELLAEEEMKELLELGSSLGLSCLVEAHGRRELEKTLAAGSEIVGINNRNLKTMEIDLKISIELLPLIPAGRIKVSESGIRSGEEAARLAGAGADAILVGEALIRSDDKIGKIRELLG